jgi:hypothetical protein
MPKADWIANNIQALFERWNLYPTGQIKTVLDVGCGLSLKSQYLDADVRVGVEIHRPFIERIDASVPYAVVNASALDLERLFLPRSFDLVLVLDLVEHLDKADALRVIEMAEAIARVAVIIETPRGFVPQDIDIWQGGGDQYQTHRSGWQPEEFTARGYEVRLRDYRMSDSKRHTSIDVDPNIVLIDAIRLMRNAAARAS